MNIEVLNEINKNKTSIFGSTAKQNLEENIETKAIIL